MPRPEKEIPGTGPAADLARQLRGARTRAGGPAYREMAERVNFSHSTLAEAANGLRCPTWECIEAYMKDCGEDPEALRPLWEEAQAVMRRRGGRPRGDRKRTSSPLPRTRPVPVTPAPGRRTTPSPDPWLARTPSQYVYQLRALRAWAGKPGASAIAIAMRDISKGTRAYYYLPSSTLYDALSPTRAKLPPLEIAQAVVQVCQADVETWTAAWQDIAMREFEAANPRSAEEGGSSPPPGPAPVPRIRLAG